MEVPKKEAERPPRGVKWKGKKDPGKEPPPPPPQQLPLTDQSNLQRKVPRPQPRSAVLVLEATDEELEDFGLQRIVAGAAGDAGGAKRKREEEQEEEEETTTTSPSLRLTGQKKRKKKQPLRRARKGDGDVGFSAAECYSSLAQSCPGGIGDVVRFRRPGLVPERPSLSRAGSVPDPFAALSDEVLLQVFRWLSRHSLSRAARCCRRFRLLAQDETLWRAVDVGGRSHLPPGAVGVLLARGARALRAARANLLAPVLSGLLPAAPTWETCKLTALDLSGASIAPGELEELLCCCRQLRKLSMENLQVTERALTEGLAKNGRLEILHLAMATGITRKGLSAVLRGCQESLRQLNLAWTSLCSDTLEELALDCLSPKLERLNISGCRDTLEDLHVEAITLSCPNLFELDVSDAVRLTHRSVKSIAERLRRIESLSTSRCYSISPTAYLSLDTDCPSLQYLNLFGVLKDHSLKELETHLAPAILINKFPFSSIARPTVGLRRTSIWGTKVSYPVKD